MGRVCEVLWTPKEVRRALDLLAGGLTRSQVAALLARKYSSVSSKVREHLPPCRGYTALAKVKRRLLRLHAAGLTFAAIARKLGCDQKTVGRWAKQLGLPANPEAARLAIAGNLPRGCDGGPEVVRLRSAADALRLGFPGYTRSEAKYLRHLFIHGEDETAGVAAALGRSATTTRQRLWQLVRAGAVRAVRTRVCGGRRYNVWALAEGVGPCDTERGRLEVLRSEAMKARIDRS